MFSLKIDLLFPSIEAAKATAKKLNASLKRPHADIDPREIKRMKDELRLAREKVRAQTMIDRQLFL